MMVVSLTGCSYTISSISDSNENVNVTGTEIKNAELEAHSQDPTWSIVIHHDELIYDSPKNYPERGKIFTVNTYVQEWGNLIFRGSTQDNEKISGSFTRQKCISEGKDHAFFVEMMLNGEKFTACGDEMIIEYNEEYNENYDKEKKIKRTNKLTDLAVWDEYAGLTLKSQEIEENLNGCLYYVGLNFTWETKQQWILVGFFDEMVGKNLFHFSALKPTEVKISYPSNDDTEQLWSASIDNDEILDEQTKQKLLNGETIEVKLTVTAYHYQGCQQSEKRTGITVQDIEVLNTKEQEDYSWNKFTASGFEPSWSIIIEGNTLKYSSPELYNPDIQEIKDIVYELDTMEYQWENLIFAGKDVKGEFIKQDCINEWRGDTSPYAVSFVREQDMVYQGCGEIAE